MRSNKALPIFEYQARLEVGFTDVDAKKASYGFISSRAVRCAIRQNQMPRTRRHITRFPSRHLTSQIELNRASICHNVTMVQPVLVPILAVDPNGLNIVTVVVIKIVGHNTKRLVAVDGHVDV